MGDAARLTGVAGLDVMVVSPAPLLGVELRAAEEEELAASAMAAMLVLVLVLSEVGVDGEVIRFRRDLLEEDERGTAAGCRGDARPTQLSISDVILSGLCVLS
jgi:hypothetical protein